CGRAALFTGFGPALYGFPSAFALTAVSASCSHLPVVTQSTSWFVLLRSLKTPAHRTVTWTVECVLSPRTRRLYTARVGPIMAPLLLPQSAQSTPSFPTRSSAVATKP